MLYFLSVLEGTIFLLLSSFLFLVLHITEQKSGLDQEIVLRGHFGKYLKYHAGIYVRKDLLTLRAGFLQY